MAMKAKDQEVLYLGSADYKECIIAGFQKTLRFGLEVEA